MKAYDPDKYWNVERFNEDRKSVEARSVGWTILAFVAVVSTCVLCDVSYLIPFALFAGGLVFVLARRFYFFKWKNELIETKNISRKKFDELCAKADPEELHYFNNKGIAVLVVLFGMFFTVSFFLKAKEEELTANGIMTTGKVVKAVAGKNGASATIEYRVVSEVYTTSVPVNYDHFESRFTYQSDSAKMEVMIGDEFKVRYSSKDPSNSETVGKFPIKR